MVLLKTLVTSSLSLPLEKLSIPLPRRLLVAKEVVVEAMLEEAYSSRLQGQRGEENRKMFMNWIIDVVGFSDMITVFNIKREEDMDKKILFALLKSENFNFQSQMFLSMVWNRVDIAEEKIFCDRNSLANSGELWKSR